MVVGKQNCIHVRKVFKIDGRIGQSSPSYAWTEMNMVTSMKKVWLDSVSTVVKKQRRSHICHHAEALPFSTQDQLTSTNIGGSLTVLSWRCLQRTDLRWSCRKAFEDDYDSCLLWAAKLDSCSLRQDPLSEAFEPVC